MSLATEDSLIRASSSSFSSRIGSGGTKEPQTKEPQTSPCAPPAGLARRALRAGVAPSDVLLTVHHLVTDTQQVHDSGFDPADYVRLFMVAALLNHGSTGRWSCRAPVVHPHPDGGAGANPADQVLRGRVRQPMVQRHPVQLALHTRRRQNWVSVVTVNPPATGCRALVQRCAQLVLFGVDAS